MRRHQISCYFTALCLLCSVQRGTFQSTLTTTTSTVPSIMATPSNTASTTPSLSPVSTSRVAVAMTSSIRFNSTTVSNMMRNATSSPVLNATSSPMLNATSSPMLNATSSPMLNATSSPMLNATSSPMLNATSSPMLNATSSPMLNATSSPMLSVTPSLMLTVASTSSSSIALIPSSSPIMTSSLMPSVIPTPPVSTQSSVPPEDTSQTIVNPPPTSSSVSSSSTPMSTPRSTTPSATGAPGVGNEPAIAIAASFAVIIIVLIVLLALVIACGIWYAKRKSTVPWYLALLGRSPSQTEGDGLQLKDKPRGMRKSVMLGSQMMDIDNGANPDQPFMSEILHRRLLPIGVPALPEHVKKLHEDMNQGFHMEYQSLEMAPQATFQASQLDGNRHKNRYRNIVPYDHSRVRLMVLPGKENSDYINANYIDGYRDPNKFIAAQGPLLETLEDFWRMVWEVKCQNIVMVTNIKEYDIVGNERTKCDKYWPEELDQELQLGLMCVKMQKETQLSDYVIRDLTISTVAGGKALDVRHFHFTVWPDHGVPLFATSLIGFIRTVNRNQLTDTTGPHVVHCSAGVGRTGTYITLNSMLERIQLEDNVNVYEFVRLMRSKRNFMVQTEEQYVFIHDALVELVTSGDTSIQSDIAVATINSYRDEDGDSYKGKTMSTLQKQFMLLEEYGRHPTEDSCAFGQVEANRHKNRFPDLVPYDDSRVRITPRNNEETDYINASFVDGYKRKRAYLVAQSPSEETVGDFWRMVHEKESAVIVMLCQLQEDGQESSYKYWPDAGETVCFGYYSVSSLHEQTEEGFILHKMNLVFSFHNKLIGSTVTNEKKVTQIRLRDWPDSAEPEKLTPFLAIINTIEKLQAANQNPPITVHCKDGMGRSGTFVTMYSVLEKLKPEHLVDVFQILKKARIQRPRLVESPAQLEMCYNFVYCYLESFDAYANFCVRSGEGRAKESGSDLDTLDATDT